MWQRGNKKQPIFIDDVDRRFFLRVLSEAARDYALCLLSYSLMDNHFHLVVETPEMTLGDAMRTAGGRYAHFFNQRHETGGGHLYQGRFKNRIVASDEQFAQLLRYVANNPVAAGMCARPEQWPWSSHRIQLGNREHPFVATGRVSDLLEVFGGPPEFRYARLFEPSSPLALIDPSESPWELRPALAAIIDLAASAESLRRARDHGYLLREIAAHTGLSIPTISKRASRG